MQMAPTGFVCNWDKLLSLVVEPSNLCLVLVLGCVVVVVNGPWTLTLLGLDLHTGTELFKWLEDEATSSAVTTLQVSLTVSALHLSRCLCYRYFGSFVEHMLPTVPLNRLLMTGLLLLVSVGVMALGYQAIGFAARLFADRISSSSVTVSLPERHHDWQEILFCKFSHNQIDENLLKHDWFYETDPRDESVTLRLNQFNLLEPKGMLRPVFLARPHRYLTEDVAMSCDLRLQLTWHTADQVHVLVRWTKDQVLVDSGRGQRVSVRSARHRVSWAAPEEEAGCAQWMAVTATLLIRRLRQEDFGQYECHVYVSSQPPSQLPTSVMEERFKLFSSLVSSHELRRYPEPSSIRTLHPSSRVDVEISYRMLADSDDDILVEHRVNGVPREELPEEDKCSSELHWPFLDFSQQQNNLVGKMADLRKNTVVCHLHRFCVEHYHYGLHTFTLRRQFYNADTGEQDYLEVMYGSVFVSPEPPKLFSDVQHNAYFSYLHDTDCWQNNQTVLSEYCTRKLKTLKALSRFHYLLDCWATMFIYILLHGYYVWWACTLIRYILCLTLPEVFSQTVVATRSGDPPEQFPVSSGKTHRVFLAYAETERELSGLVKTLLEAYDLVVYDSLQDPPHGQPLLSAWDEAMDSCSGFVVLLSVDYLRQSDLRFQFQSIHNMMLEQRIRKNDIVLVVSGSSHIPPAIGTVPIVDLHQKHWDRILEWWAFCFKGEFPNRSLITQVGRDIRRDTCQFVMHNTRDDDVKQVLRESSFVFRTLQAVCKPPRSWQEHEKDVQPGKATDRSESCLPDSQSSTQSPGRPDMSESDSDISDEDLLLPRLGSAVKADRGQGEARRPARRTLEAADQGTEGSVDVHDVFLTYCEESAWDREVAGQIKAALEGSSLQHQLFPQGQGLRVHDAVQDVLPGQAEIHVVSSAAKSSSFVVLLSPAFVQDPICRRLHFPQVLQAVYSDAVDTDRVLIVHTSGCLPRRRVSTDDHHGHSTSTLRTLLKEVCLSVMAIPSTSREVKGEWEAGLQLPKWFQAFTHLHWSPCMGLCEEERLKQWARRVKGCVKRSA